MTREIIWGAELWRRCSTDGRRVTCATIAGETAPAKEELEPVQRLGGGAGI